MSSQWIGARENDLVRFISSRNANYTCLVGQLCPLAGATSPHFLSRILLESCDISGRAAWEAANNNLVIPRPVNSRFNRHDGTVNDVTTVQLGQYSREQANAIAGELEKAEISWWYKEPGVFSRIWEYGVRLFVDKERLDEARSIARRVTAKPTT